MLVLKREESESIIIDGCIEVQIIAVCGGKVTLGIIAPRNISVHRKEIQAQIDREKGEQNGVESNLSGSTS